MPRFLLLLLVLSGCVLNKSNMRRDAEEENSDGTALTFTRDGVTYNCKWRNWRLRCERVDINDDGNDDGTGGNNGGGDSEESTLNKLKAAMDCDKEGAVCRKGDDANYPYEYDFEPKFGKYPVDLLPIQKDADVLNSWVHDGYEFELGHIIEQQVLSLASSSVRYSAIGQSASGNELIGVQFTATNYPRSLDNSAGLEALLEFPRAGTQRFYVVCHDALSFIEAPAATSIAPYRAFYMLSIRIAEGACLLKTSVQSPEFTAYESAARVLENDPGDVPADGETSLDTLQHMIDCDAADTSCTKNEGSEYPWEYHIRPSQSEYGVPLHALKRGFTDERRASYAKRGLEFDREKIFETQDIDASGSTLTYAAQGETEAGDALIVFAIGASTEPSIDGSRGLEALFSYPREGTEHFVIACRNKQGFEEVKTTNFAPYRGEFLLYMQTADDTCRLKTSSPSDDFNAHEIYLR